MRDKGEVTVGQHVLVVGASGGVGSFAVQIAKALGAVVTGVASGTKLDMVRSIGADHVIDYGLEDFTESDQRYDVIIDTGGAGRGLRAIALSPFVKHTLRNFIAGNKTEDLLTLKDLIEAGDVTPVVDKTFPLSAAADAIRYMTDGRATGKIVVTI